MKKRKQTTENRVRRDPAYQGLANDFGLPVTDISSGITYKPLNNKKKKGKAK